MQKILVFIDWFDPAYKAGGPVIAAVNFANNMQDDYHIFIFTGDRDLGDNTPFENHERDKWVFWNENVSVFYSSPANRTLSKIQLEIATIQPDFIYLHSLFSKSFSIFPMMLFRMGKIQANMVVAPRGGLRSSALAQKSIKKSIFLKLFRGMGMSKNIIFHATDETEERDIRAHLGNGVTVFVIPDFAAHQSGYQSPPIKFIDELKLIFVGRIHPIKNLDFILECLKSINSKILFTIVGPVEDAAYWAYCSSIIDNLPENITVIVRNGLPHAAITELVSRHDAFVLPTKGENFGHAIYEALSVGRPVLISDQTPWLNLTAQKAGWDLPLQDQGAFIEIINKLAAMDAPELEKWCQAAWKFCNRYVQDSDIKFRYQQLFKEGLADRLASI